MEGAREAGVLYAPGDAFYPDGRGRNCIRLGFSRLTPEHPDVQIIDGVLPAYGVPQSELSDYLTPAWSDEYIDVRTEEAYATAHEVLRAEGLFLGTSAAAALHAAVQVGRRPENAGKNIAIIIPDNGMKYLSTPMYQ